MKAKFLTAALLLFYTVSFAQNTKPVTRPGLPTPTNLRMLTPADLEVVKLQLIAAEKNNSEKLSYVTVTISIKNSGQIAAPTTKVNAFVKKQEASKWTKVDQLTAFPAIKPGETVTQKIIFKIPYAVIAPMYFELKVMADAGNSVKESNEQNNSSVGILIGL